MTKLFAPIFGLAFGIAIAASTAGCESAERIYDCNDICTKYRDCVDADYDVAACRDRCVDNAKDSDAFADTADDCQACVDDRSCLGAAFSCAAECVAIVP